MDELLVNKVFNDQNLGIILQFLDVKSYKNLRLINKYFSNILKLTNNNNCLKVIVKLWLNNETNKDVFNKIGHISKWNVSYITNMSELFKEKTTFNNDISNWDTSNVTNMNGMFYRTYAFNQDISNWNISSVTDMKNMLNRTYAFNQDISGWNTSNVTNMSSLFYNARKFNKPLNNWNTSKEPICI